MKLMGKFKDCCNGCNSTENLHNIVVIVGEGKEKCEDAYKKKVTLCSACWNKISHIVPLHSFDGKEELFTYSSIHIGFSD